MPDEIVVEEGSIQETPEQEPVVTTEPETEAVPESEKKEEPVAKTFTQEELEAEIGKRLARERRKIERERAAQAEPPPLQIESKLDPSQFQTTEAYVEALANERADAIAAHREQSKSVNEINDRYQDQVDAALDKYPDFIQVAHTHKFMTPEMAQVIKASDIAVELAYHLGTNLNEAERIFRLPPMLQVKELGKLEAKLESSPPEVKKISSAPEPIKPVQGGKSVNPVYDTTDPRSAKTMSASEWIAADRARRAKLYASQGLK
jgi:hypothetical protein